MCVLLAQIPNIECTIRVLFLMLGKIPLQMIRLGCILSRLDFLFAALLF